MKNGVLEVHLVAREGEWHPYGPNGPPVTIVAFGEVEKPLRTPGPMLRVKAGTPPDAWLDPSCRLYRFQALVFKEAEPRGRVVRLEL